MDVEVLIPSFEADERLISLVVSSGPDTVSHNVEAVERIIKKLRNRNTYPISLKALSAIKKTGAKMIKTGIMLGLGETEAEVLQTIDEIAELKCDILTIGQYLQPSKDRVPVERYIPLEEFDIYRKRAEKAGIPLVFSGPFVRSSYVP